MASAPPHQRQVQKEVIKEHSLALVSAAGEGEATQQPHPAATSTNYRPFPVDWRFMPEPALLAKDTLLHALTQTSRALANAPWSRPLWAHLAQRRVLAPVLAARQLFIHIPKTGGTSVCSLLYQRNIPHLSAETIFGLYGPQLRGIPSFSIIRHPVARTLSAFHYIKHGGTKIMAASRFEMFRLGKPQVFEDFVAMLEADPHRLSYSSLLAPQHSFVCDAQGQVQVDALFCLSSPSSMRGLCRWLDIDALPHLNESLRRSASVGQDTIRRIERLYARDFDLFENVMTGAG
jgi:hypothetical protein